LPAVSDRIEHSYRQVLRDRRLAVLLGGDLVSKTGDGMNIVALPLLALRIHGSVNPALAVALVSAAPYTLAVAVSFVFGLGRRRFRPRGLLMADCLARFAVFTSVALLAMVSALPLWALGAALFAGSGLRLLAASGQRLMAAELAGERGRFAVNGLLGTGESLAAYIVGPVVGGVLATAVSPGFVLLLDGVSFLGLLAAIRAAVPPGTGDPAGTGSGSGSPTDSNAGPATGPSTGPSTDPTPDPASGWSILRRVPVAAWLFVVVFCFNLFYMPVEVALPLLVRGPLHAGGTALGEIWTGFGVGALLGAVCTGLLRRLPQTALLVGIIGGWGAAMLFLAAAPNVTTAAIVFAVGGLIYAPFTPVAYSLVQSKLRPDQQQPVLTLWAAGSAVAAPIGLILAGPLIQLTGIRPGLLVSAVLTLALVPAAGSIRNREAPVDEPQVT
jgi:MFS family permease